MIRLNQMFINLTKLNKRKVISVIFGFISFCLTSALFNSEILGQITENPSLQIPKVNSFLASGNNANIETGKVYLDGYELFTLAAPALQNQDSNQTTGLTPIEKRVRAIENNLYRFVNIDEPASQLQVDYTIDENSNLPVISINKKYLMTVTTLDAQLQGISPKLLASEFTQEIKQALITSQQERQPKYLIKQSLWAGLIILITTILIILVRFFQRRIHSQQKQLKSEIASESQVISQPKEETEIKVITSAVKVIKKQQGYNVYDIQKLFLRLAQIGIIGSSIFVILGLFPYTRRFQPFIYSAPLKVFFVAFGMYMLIRIGNFVIDKLLNIFNHSSLVTPSNYQRLALRITTFSQVLKSINAVIWIGIGILIGLSLLGVDILPLLAGAGIIGLAISFASQGLIKDIINGSLILIEDQYAVGDVIVVDKVAGFVENMNLRITQLRDNEGRLITIPNSAISIVQNLSKDWSRVDLTIDVAYQTDPNHALSVIHQLAEEIYQEPIWRERIPELPEVLGIDKIDHGGMLIRVWIKTKPLQQWAVAREFRRRLRMVMEREGIDIGIPQDTIWFKSNLQVEKHRNGNQTQKYDLKS